MSTKKHYLRPRIRGRGLRFTLRSSRLDATSQEKLIVRRKDIAVLIYSLAAVADSLFWVTNQQERSASGALLVWLFLFAAPLLFVFAYPRFLFADFPPKSSRLRYVAIFHGLAAATTTLLFVIFGSLFWKNPMRDADSVLLLAIPIVALPAFLVAAISLLLKNKSTLAKFASFLFWPYWLLLALVLLGRLFEPNVFRSTFCFLCFLSSILFAFAAGAIARRPAIAHCSALAGLVGMPWVYWTTLQDTPLGNIWTNFNVPDRELLMYNAQRLAELTIFSVVLIVLAIATAALRLLPAHWSIRGLPLCERTWPAFGGSLLFVAIWFSQSVMPYRISGAVDYASWPIFQILHVEKRGLQFHETCISVRGYQSHPESVTFSGNDRRLFQYRFRQNYASGDLPSPLKDRVEAIIRASQVPSRNWVAVKPLRTWNVEGWYVTGQGIELKAYTTDTGTIPPQEIVDLFHDLDKLSRVGETQSDRKDVCLGFCYDPISGLGLLFANHRCHYDAALRRYVCR